MSSPVAAPKAATAAVKANVKSAVKPAAAKVAKPRAKATVSTHKARTTTAPVAAAPVEISAHQIADLAYFLWMDRGCPAGSSEEDWFRAEAQLRAQATTA